MDEAIAAVITGVAAVIVSVINSHYQAKATRSLIEYKIEELTKRVDKHNNVIERTYELEQGQALLYEKMKVANNRIADLEEKG